MGLLKEKFSDLANEYAKEFVMRIFMPDSVSELYWCGDEVGGILAIEDFYVGFDDIRTVIDNDIDSDTFFRWYFYCERVGHISKELDIPNLISFQKGCPVLSEESLTNLEILKEKIDNAKKDFMKELENIKKYEQL